MSDNTRLSTDDYTNDPGTPSQAEGEDDPGSSASDNPHAPQDQAEGEKDDEKDGEG